MFKSKNECPLPLESDLLNGNTRKDVKEFVDDLRQEWKIMWRSRIDDKVRAESIADKSYQRLLIDRGVILYATRKFKPPDFQEILENYLTPLEIERVNPNPARGGIRNFIREYITPQSRSERKTKVLKELNEMKQFSQSKHGGRGWLHISMSKS